MLRKNIVLEDLCEGVLKGYNPAKMYVYKRNGDICVWFSKKKPKKGGDGSEN